MASSITDKNYEQIKAKPKRSLKMSDYSKFKKAKTRQEWMKFFPDVLDMAEDVSEKSGMPLYACLFSILEVIKTRMFDRAEIKEMADIADGYRAKVLGENADK